MDSLFLYCYVKPCCLCGSSEEVEEVIISLMTLSAGRAHLHFIDEGLVVVEGQ